MVFTCPRCGRTSWHPEDARQGYCAACCDWTGRRQRPAGTLSIGGFEIRLIADPSVPAGYVRLRSDLPPRDPNTLATFITSSHTDYQSSPEIPAREQSGDDGYPWSDAATWSPGYGEL